MVQCPCGKTLGVREVEEVDDSTYWLKVECPSCGGRLGIEADREESAPFFTHMLWTNDALHELERLPPYVVFLVRSDVEQYARTNGILLISVGVMIEAKNQGTVAWTLDAENRLTRVPAAVRAMARVELERTALDRGMPEVTVSLMEEVKARYFGMGTGVS